MLPALDNDVLRRSTPKEVGHVLRTSLKRTKPEDITSQLLASTESGSLSPQVASAWLSASPSLKSTQEALLQEHSFLVRTSAIKRFGKFLRRAYWKKAWDALGGTAGIVELFGRLSVAHVNLLCQSIGRTSTSAKAPGRAEAVTELLQSLLPAEYPHALYKNIDERPLHRYYKQLVPACTFDFIKSLLEHKQSRLLQHVSKKRLFHAYPQEFQNVAFDVYARRPAPFEQIDMRPFLTSVPPQPGSIPKFSAPMNFTFDLMQRHSIGHRTMTPDIFLDELAVPLLRRAMRKRVSSITVKTILDLIIAYCSDTTHKDAKERLNLNTNGLLFNVIRLWSRNSALFEAPLTTLLEFLPAGRIADVDSLLSVIGNVPISARYRLLRLLLMLSKSTRIDIERGLDLKSDVVQKWPTSLFLLLPQQCSVVLLTRLAEARPAMDWLTHDSIRDLSIFSEAPSPSTKHGDVPMLMTWLERGSDGALHRAKSALNECKKMALTSREQNDRAFYAKRALFFAVAGGSLDLYKETLVWARRFNRDALTIKTLYSQAAVSTAEVIELLTAVPEKPARGSTADQVRASVEKANDVLLQLLDTACMCIREPAFYARDWAAVCGLFCRVVGRRVNNVTKFRTVMGISEPSLYDLVWKNTIEMLNIAETTALNPAHEPLDFRSLHGPLTSGLGISPDTKLLPSTCAFFNELARRRGKLWREYRLTVHPAAAALSSPWPKGLALQYLVPIEATSNFAGNAPFVVSRAEKIVFMGAQLAMAPIPHDEETKAAIGPFIDDYRYALDVWVSQTADGHEREQRIKKAWDHAVDELSGNHITNDEATRLWGSVSPLFAPLLAHRQRTTQKRYPILPETTDSAEPTEWNPAEFKPAKIEARVVEPRVAIDCYLRACFSYRATINSKFDDTKRTSIPALESYGIWSPSNLERGVSFDVRDGTIASALLYLDSRKSTGSRLLSRPFPHVEDSRYPSIYLSEDFLLGPGLNANEALAVIESSRQDVPPTLLAELCNSMIEALPPSLASSKDLEDKERIAFVLLSALAAGDRPELASNMILRIIFERPESSSWHRKLLSARFFARLSAAEADKFMRSFADRTCAELLKQRERKLQASNPQSATSISATTFVKVSTVKALAQLLHNSEFVAPGTSVGILVRLFQSSSHVDVRVAVIESLLDMLQGCSEPSSVALREKLMNALEAAIPVASALNERYPFTEEDWLDAETKDELPELYDEGGIMTMPPILNQIILAIDNSTHPKPISIRLELADRIILPLIEHSIANHDRWIRMFLRKLGHSAVVLPSFPPFPTVLTRILSSGLDVAQDCTFAMYGSFVLVNMQPSKQLVAVNEQIQESIEHMSSNAGRHWLSMYNRGIEAYQYGGTSTARQICLPMTVRADALGVKVSHMQQLVFKQAAIIIDKADVMFEDWNKFVHHLELRPQHRDEQIPWQQHAKPVVERIISYIRSLRTTVWTNDPGRRPAVLPETFALELWMLTYPMTLSENEDMRRFTILGEELGAFISNVASGDEPFHGRFAQIIRAAQKTRPQDKACVACALMRTRERPYLKSPDLVDLLCVGLADALLLGAEKPQRQQTVIDMKELLKAWEESPVESVRMRGLKTTRLISQKAKGQDWF